MKHASDVRKTDHGKGDQEDTGWRAEIGEGTSLRKWDTTKTLTDMRELVVCERRVLQAEGIAEARVIRWGCAWLFLKLPGSQWGWNEVREGEVGRGGNGRAAGLLWGVNEGWIVSGQGFLALPLGVKWGPSQESELRTDRACLNRLLLAADWEESTGEVNTGREKTHLPGRRQCWLRPRWSWSDPR